MLRFLKTPVDPEVVSPQQELCDTPSEILLRGLPVTEAGFFEERVFSREPSRKLSFEHRCPQPNCPDGRLRRLVNLETSNGYGRILKSENVVPSLLGYGTARRRAA